MDRTSYKYQTPYIVAIRFVTIRLTDEDKLRFFERIKGNNALVYSSQMPYVFNCQKHTPLYT